MARETKLVSQFAILSDSMRETMRTTSFLREAMEKALVTMSADIEAKAKSMTTLGRGLLPTWPFGTVVQHESLIGVRAMVLTDNGTLCKVMTLDRSLGRKVGLGPGAVIETGRSIWAPVED